MKLCSGKCQSVMAETEDTAWFAVIDKEWGALKQCFETYLADSNFNDGEMPKISLSCLTKPLLYKIDD